MKRIIAVVALFSVYQTTFLVAVIGRLRRKRVRAVSGKILLVGTFDHASWFSSHVDPILKSGHSEVIVVTDEPIVDLDGVTYVCPPDIAAKLLSRALAKFIWSIIAMRRHDPDLCMGYHVFPAGVIALFCGSIFGRLSAFQVTAGPIELEGGGYGAENRLLSSLGAPSSLVERSAHRMVKMFDLVVVRGNEAQEYIRSIGFQNRVEIITGSVDIPSVRKPFHERTHDVAFVGRIAECKRLDRFLGVMAELLEQRPKIGAIIVGDGPDRERLESDTIKRGLNQYVKWVGKSSRVADLLAQTRVFVLTSSTEGVSIAMLEAMAAGCVPVVSDVGDLRDFVQTDNNGFIVPETALPEFADCIDELLADPSQWDRMSRAAKASVEARASKSAIGQRWQSVLASILPQDSKNKAV